MDHPWFWWQDTKFPIITLLLLLLCSLIQSRLTLRDPIDCSMPSLPVLHCLLGFAQSLVHWVDNAIQLSHSLCPLLLLLSIFSASGSFPMSQFFASGGPSIGASATVLPMCIQGWFRIDWFDLLAFQGTFKGLLQHHNSKASILQLSLFYGPTLIPIHDYWQNHSFDYMDLCQQSDVSAF